MLTEAMGFGRLMFYRYMLKVCELMVKSKRK